MEINDPVPLPSAAHPLASAAHEITRRNSISLVSSGTSDRVAPNAAGDATSRPRRERLNHVGRRISFEVVGEIKDYLKTDAQKDIVEAKISDIVSEKLYNHTIQPRDMDVITRQKKEIPDAPPAYFAQPSQRSTVDPLEFIRQNYGKLIDRSQRSEDNLVFTWATLKKLDPVLYSRLKNKKKRAENSR